KSQIEDLKSKASKEEQDQPKYEKPAEPVKRSLRNPVVEAQLQKLNQEIEDQTKAQHQLEEQINTHVSRLEREPFFEQKILGLMRDYDTFRVHYTDLLDKKLGAEMASALETRQKGERFVILDAAQVAERPFAPNRPMMILAGFLGGLLGGLGLAI